MTNSNIYHSRGKSVNDTPLASNTNYCDQWVLSSPFNSGFGKVVFPTGELGPYVQSNNLPLFHYGTFLPKADPESGYEFDGPIGLISDPFDPSRSVPDIKELVLSAYRNGILKNHNVYIDELKLPLALEQLENFISINKWVPLRADLPTPMLIESRPLSSDPYLIERFGNLYYATRNVIGNERLETIYYKRNLLTNETKTVQEILHKNMVTNVSDYKFEEVFGPFSQNEITE